MRTLKIQKSLRKKANKAKAQAIARFFKTGPGTYSDGDIFLGCFRSSQELRSLALENQNMSFDDLSALLKSPYHEERALALEIFVQQYQKEHFPRQKLIRFYLQNKNGINNWDLVDISAYKTLGDYCYTHKKQELILNLSKSPRHWDRRIAMVSTLAFTRQNNFDLTYLLAERFLNDSEDLMHKAAGWMLREAGKRDPQRLLKFIKVHGKKMPRTMLRYAVEKFPEKIRKQILMQTRARPLPQGC